MQVNVRGAWRKATPYVNVGGAWKRVDKGYVNVGGTWREFFSSWTWKPTPNAFATQFYFSFESQRLYTQIANYQMDKTLAQGLKGVQAQETRSAYMSVSKTGASSTLTLNLSAFVPTDGYSAAELQSRFVEDFTEGRLKLQLTYGGKSYTLDGSMVTVAGPGSLSINPNNAAAIYSTFVGGLSSSNYITPRALWISTEG